MRTRASKSGTPVKVVILSLLASLLWKRLQIGMGMLPITTNASDELFSRINIDGIFIDFCDLRLQRTLQEWTATKWLEVDWQFANRNCYRLSRISWALAQISCQIGDWMKAGGKCAFLNGKLVISRKRSEIRPRLLLVTNRKWHTPFQVKWKSSSLDDLEGHWQPVGYPGDSWAFCSIA